MFDDGKCRGISPRGLKKNSRWLRGRQPPAFVGEKEGTSAMAGPQQADNHSNLIYDTHEGRFARGGIFLVAVLRPFCPLRALLLSQGGKDFATFFVIRKLIVRGAARRKDHVFNIRKSRIG